MSHNLPRTIWLAIMFGALLATFPTWSDPSKQVMSGYDAPWIYPGLNPAVVKRAHL